MEDGSGRQAAILGGGQRGAGWAARFLLHGWDVAVFDPDPAAHARIEAVLEAARATLPALYDLPLPREGKLRLVPRISETVAEAEWIAECAPERLDLKRKLYQQVQAHCRPEAVIASASGRFTASALQGCATRPEAIVLAHAFVPVYLLPVVELSGGGHAGEGLVAAAAEVLRGLGMAPVVAGAEAEGIVAGRLAEALWREALWMVAEGQAGPAEIDTALSHGPALMWAVAGLFGAARLSGGEGGLAATLDGARAELALPRSHLTDLPPLDAALVQRIVARTPPGPDAAGRDGGLVGLLRALRDRGLGAGATLAAAEAARTAAAPDGPLRAIAAPLVLARLQVLPSWIDYNGHMTESRYLFAVSETTDALLRALGVDGDYVAAGHSYYTVETHLRHLAETRAGDRLTGTVQILGHDDRRLHLFVRILRDNVPVATAEQMLLHVDTVRGHAAPAPDAVRERLQPLAEAHADLPAPEGAGRRIGQPREG